jgi:hypothetical protein
VHARRFDSIRIVENAFVHARRFDSGIRFEIVESAKLLGVIISNNLTWHAHIKEVVKKASKRLYSKRRSTSLLSLPSAIFKVFMKRLKIFSEIVLIL